MFDKQNFIQALMFLTQEAYHKQQYNFVHILENTIKEIKECDGSAQEANEAASYPYSSLVEQFLALGRQEQKTLIKALEAQELSLKQ